MIPYAPSTPYQRNGTVADLMMQAGQQQAQAQAQKGAIWGRALGNIGEIASGAVQDYQKQKAQAPIIAAKLADEQSQRQARDLGTQKTQMEIDQMQRDQAQGEMLKSLYADPANPPTQSKIASIVGPERAAAIVKLHGVADPAKQYKDVSELLRDGLLGVAALPESARPEGYKITVDSIRARGIPVDQIAPPEYDANSFARLLNYGKAPEVAKPETRSLQVQYGEALAKGDKEGAARLLKAIKDTGQADDRPKEDAVVKVEHQDENGQTVIEYMPKSEVRGKTFKKGLGVTESNRANAAASVNAVGNNIVAKLSDPAFAKAIGPVMGRYNSLKELIGNPPPELSELAGEIESYSLANMGVHGMRSVQGAEKIQNLLNTKHTPESLIRAIKGLQTFSDEYLKTVGRAPASAPDSKPPASSTAPSYKEGDVVSNAAGQKLQLRGNAWVPVK